MTGEALQRETDGADSDSDNGYGGEREDHVLREERKCFASGEEFDGVRLLLESWKEDEEGGVKRAFRSLKDTLVSLDGTVLGFVSRPGVSFSLRAAVPGRGESARPLFVMVDVIDDAEDDRWLSVCFYEDTITDPSEQGDVVPEGLLGEDGYCFDLTEGDADGIAYLEARIREAHASAV